MAEKFWHELEKCVEEFQNLMLVVLKRRAFLKSLEKSILNKSFKDTSFIDFFCYDYLRSQLTDLRKFFENDGRAYKFSFVIEHVLDKEIIKNYKQIYENKWKQDRLWQISLEQIANKIVMHHEKFYSPPGAVPTAQIDNFIDSLNEFLDRVVQRLYEQGCGVNFMFRDPNSDFLKNQQDQAFNEFVKMAKLPTSNSNKRKEILFDDAYLNNLMQLVYSADINFRVCEEIYRNIEKVKKEERDFLILFANNSFNESLSTLYTLIYSVKEEELTIKPLLEKVIKDQENNRGLTLENKIILDFTNFLYTNYPNIDLLNYNFKDIDLLHNDIKQRIQVQKTIQTGLFDFQELRNKFDTYNFCKIRNTSIDHKNKRLDSPAGAIRLFLKEDLLKNLGEIIKILKINCFFWFNYQITNPHEYILHSLKQKYF